MGKLILTSAGFDNKIIEYKFLELVGTSPRNIRVLFIPTAAVTEEQKGIIPLCKDDLLTAGIPDRNIVSYNLDRPLSTAEIGAFQAIYVCGGDPEYLLAQMHAAQFQPALRAFLDNGGVYIGVSAGSIVMAENLAQNLAYLNCSLHVHAERGEETGYIDPSSCQVISLSDSQALLIIDNEVSVVG